MSQLIELLESAQKQVFQANDLLELDKVRVAYLGKKGHITQLLKDLKNLDIDARKKHGQAVNEAKDKLENWLYSCYLGDFCIVIIIICFK